MIRIKNCFRSEREVVQKVTVSNIIEGQYVKNISWIFCLALLTLLSNLQLGLLLTADLKAMLRLLFFHKLFKRCHNYESL